jgi:cytochrome c peroxidase
MTTAAIVAAAVIAGSIVSAQVAPPSQPLGSLKNVPIPEPSNLGDFVKDKTAAIRLGKSLFWDMQVGSDGKQSCATCHFHAGTDSRSKNQIHPGADTIFNTGGSPNYQLKAEDYPFHKLADVNDRASSATDSNDVTGSQGVNLSQFLDIIPGSAVDKTTVQPDPVFNVQKTNVRQVTGRNTPSAINAIFNFRNFWDGRAQNDFNGQNPFGSRDPKASVLKSLDNNSLPQPTKISLNNASLASQAVGPPLSSVEESATGRVFPDVGQKFNPDIKIKKLPRETGKKLKTLTPLAKQIVAADDSVLGTYSNSPKPGLKQKTYEAMIQDAFKKEWWDSQYIVKIGADNSLNFIKQPQGAKATDEFTVMDYNFPLFMGLSIQLYEATLVSNESPFDKFMEGGNTLSAKQIQGKALFEGKAKCINCHGGPEFTNASVRNVQNQRLERMVMGNNGVAVYDNGFYNIGVRPTTDDLGVGGKDPFGNPLSESRLAQQGKFSDPNLSPPVSANERVAVDGAFKTPGLRNVELTAPYFHNGGQLTLRQVVDFYNRGGDFHEQNIDNLDADIQNLGLTEEEKEALVAFLKGLTDERVRKQSAPFDHPQLLISNGHPGNQNSVTNDGSGQATDTMLEIPAVGRNGNSGIPNFLEAAVQQAPAARSYAPGTGYTQQDCPAGTTFQPLPGGFVCQ